MVVDSLEPRVRFMLLRPDSGCELLLDALCGTAADASVCIIAESPNIGKLVSACAMDGRVRTVRSLRSVLALELLTTAGPVDAATTRRAAVEAAAAGAVTDALAALCATDARASALRPTR